MKNFFLGIGNIITFLWTVIFPKKVELIGTVYKDADINDVEEAYAINPEEIYSQNLPFNEQLIVVDIDNGMTIKAVLHRSLNNKLSLFKKGVKVKIVKIIYGSNVTPNEEYEITALA